MSHRPPILSNGLWLAGDRGVRMAGGLLVYVVLARYLGPERFGILNLALALVAIFGVLATLGLNGILVKDLVEREGERSGLINAALLSRLFAGVAAAIAVCLVSFWLRPDDPIFVSVSAILSTLLIVRTYQVFNYYFESQTNGKVYVLVENFAFLVAAVFKVALVLGGQGLIAIAIVIVVEAAVAATLMTFNYVRATRGNHELAFDHQIAIRLVRRGFPLVLSGLALILYMRIDQVMLGVMIDDRAVGVYSAAARVFEVWFFIPTIICVSIFPLLLRLRAEDSATYDQVLEGLYSVLALIGLCVAVVLTVFSGILVNLFGEDYRESVNVLVILSWASIFAFFGFASGRWYIAEGLQIFALYRNLAGLLLAVIANLLLIPMFGVVGAAWGTLIAYLCSGYIFDAFNLKTRKVFVQKTRSFHPTGFVKRVKWLTQWALKANR